MTGDYHLLQAWMDPVPLHTRWLVTGHVPDPAGHQVLLLRTPHSLNCHLSAVNPPVSVPASSAWAWFCRVRAKSRNLGKESVEVVRAPGFWSRLCRWEDMAGGGTDVCGAGWGVG